MMEDGYTKEQMDAAAESAGKRIAEIARNAEPLSAEESERFLAGILANNPQE